MHLPALVPPEVFEALQRRPGGTARERMLRELAEAVEVLMTASIAWKLTLPWGW